MLPPNSTSVAHLSVVPVGYCFYGNRNCENDRVEAGQRYCVSWRDALKSDLANRLSCPSVDRHPQARATRYVMRVEGSCGVLTAKESYSAALACSGAESS